MSKREHGVAEKGKSFDPKDLPEAGASPDEPIAAPAPGLPVSDEEYERMKERARKTVISSDSIAQEDRPGNKRKP